MPPGAFVFQLSAYFSHGGVGLGLGCWPRHHAGDVEVLDDQGVVFLGEGVGHLVGGVVPEAAYTAVAFVDAPLGFPPSTGPFGSAGLGPLPASELPFHSVVGLGVLVGHAV